MTPVPSLLSGSANASSTVAGPASVGGSSRFAETLAGRARRPAGTTHTFEAWWSKAVRHEGTLASWQAQPKNRFDRGGRTHYGITERTFRACSGAAQLPPTPAAFEGMTQAQAKSIAKAVWRTSGADRLENPAVAIVVGDWFWGSNSACWRHVNAALRAQGYAVPNGAEFGAQTVDVLNRLPGSVALPLLSEARRAHHQRIVERDSTQRVFLDGWQRRTEAMLASAERIDANPSLEGALRVVRTGASSDDVPPVTDSPLVRASRSVPERTPCDALVPCVRDSLQYRPFAKTTRKPAQSVDRCYPTIIC